MLVAGCSIPSKNLVQYPDTTTQETIDKHFAGTWIAENSSAEFKILIKRGEVYLKGKDSEDGEKFKVSELIWTKSTIRGTIIMPSTHTKLHIKLTIQNKNTLQCQFSGSSSGKTIWKRMGKM